MTSSSISDVAVLDASANALSKRLSQIALISLGIPWDRRWISEISSGDMTVWLGIRQSQTGC